MAIDIDSPEQHAAMIEKLDLPFPMLSDPDRSLAIEPYGLSNPDDARRLAITATLLIDPAGDEVERLVSRDYADRPPEEHVLETLRGLGLDAVDQPVPKVGRAEPGPYAMRLSDLTTYFRGAKFGVKAVGTRTEDGHREAAVFGELMDRYIEDVKATFKAIRARDAG